MYSSLGRFDLALRSLLCRHVWDGNPGQEVSGTFLKCFELDTLQDVQGAPSLAPVARLLSKCFSHMVNVWASHGCRDRKSVV